MIKISSDRLFFFMGIKDYSLKKSEILLKVEEFTDSYNLIKLRILLKEFSSYIADHKKRKESQYLDEDIEKELNERKINDKRKIIVTDPNGIDVYLTTRSKEALFYPEYFKRCYEFIDILKKLIEAELAPFDNILDNPGVSEATSTNSKPKQSNKLRINLKMYGFFELEKIKNLSINEINNLLGFIADSKAPYQIAMFDYLEFLTYLNKEFFNTKKDMHKCISEILGVDERTVRGNINILIKGSNDDKSRYTSLKFKETVQRDYQSLTKGVLPA